MKSCINEQLAAQCQADPEAEASVVVTLVESAVEKDADRLKALNLEPIDASLGIYTTTLTGEALLKLADDDAVEMIEPDYEQGTFG